VARSPGAAAGQDIPISTEKLEGASHFVNKLWNAGKYVRHALQISCGKSGEELSTTEPIDVAALSGLPERYIISKCHLLEQSVTEKLEAYSIAEAAKEIQDFLWDDFADWYIESSKKSLQDRSRSAETQRVLLYVWSACLRLLHPYMPYLTEALWQALPSSQNS
jgi:valyl-tRNA synthetase